MTKPCKLCKYLQFGKDWSCAKNCGMLETAGIEDGFVCEYFAIDYYLIKRAKEITKLINQIKKVLASMPLENPISQSSKDDKKD